MSCSPWCLSKSTHRVPQCVLKYDHHCPWVGHCVGARNHRVSERTGLVSAWTYADGPVQFFMIFVFWAFLFCAWTFATLVGLNAHASSVRPNYELDGQHIAIIAL